MSLVDKYAFRLTVFWALAAAFSVAYSESKPVRLFSECFLLLPAAYLVFGLNIAGCESTTYRLLTHPILLLGGKISYAAYLLQFPVWTYIDAAAYGTFGNRYVFPFFLCRKILLALYCVVRVDSDGVWYDPARVSSPSRYEERTQYTHTIN